ncbi:hypothetical protein DEH84_16690 [Aquabacterium olei]|uniref:DUF1232 domain-containing protein n=1 Tax=Aquabacterium olei TaxID=1296669 RepID=A0A2U8FWR4_9BURK|nr:YkvA family protein [Aquabacterium olei]AWI54874.1 hypothetical protein DEH84_16690 [Aquabacterium olei]
MSLFDRLRTWARRMKRDVALVWFAARDPRTPTSVRLLALAVTAYALSPIDLIPDFIPVLGYLDDVILVPLGIWLIVRLLPPAVLADARARADALTERLPRVAAMAGLFILIWVVGAAAFGWWLWGRMAS